jgi:hypothetical protein
VSRTLFPVLVLLCSTGASLPAQAGVPAAIRHQLSERYPGWHFAGLTTESGPTMLSGGSPAWISGDFDGDARTDYALQVVVRENQDSLQRVIAFLARGRDYKATTLDSFPASGMAYLVRAARGEKRVDLDADPNGEQHLRLEHDGIDIVFGEVAASTCIYQRVRFRCVISGD